MWKCLGTLALTLSVTGAGGLMSACTGSGFTRADPGAVVEVANEYWRTQSARQAFLASYGEKYYLPSPFYQLEGFIAGLEPRTIDRGTKNISRSMAHELSGEAEINEVGGSGSAKVSGRSKATVTYMIAMVTPRAAIKGINADPEILRSLRQAGTDARVVLRNLVVLKGSWEEKAALNTEAELNLKFFGDGPPKLHGSSEGKSEEKTDYGMPVVWGYQLHSIVWKRTRCGYRVCKLVPDRVGIPL